MSEFENFAAYERGDWIGMFDDPAATRHFRPWHSADDTDSSEPQVVTDEGAGAGADQTEAALHAEVFARGFEEGRRTVELELADERAAVARFAESLEALRPEPHAALAAVLAETVERLVRQIVGGVEIDAALFANRAAEAAALVADEIQPSSLVVHPDDMPLLKEARIPLELASDDNMERGSFRIECAGGWIEDGRSVRLDRLRSALDRLGAPE
jgi:flagellar assembly protein FliH